MPMKLATVYKITHNRYSFMAECKPYGAVGTTEMEALANLQELLDFPGDDNQDIPPDDTVCPEFISFIQRQIWFAAYQVDDLEQATYLEDTLLSEVLHEIARNPSVNPKELAELVLKTKRWSFKRLRL